VRYVYSTTNFNPNREKRSRFIYFSGKKVKYIKSNPFKELQLHRIDLPYGRWAGQLVQIAGNLCPEKSSAAWARNIALVPNRERMEMICRTLRAFCVDGKADESVDSRRLAMLGEPAQVKKWLAASLDKTIRLQLDPRPMLSALLALERPAWIRQ
jgi:hypothetical protein